MKRSNVCVMCLLLAASVLTGCGNESWLTSDPVEHRVAVLRTPRWERPELPEPSESVPPHLPSWDVTQTERQWRYIVIHHSASNYGNAATFDQAHRDRGWDELGYHFVINNGHGGRDGKVEVGPRWSKQKHGAHCGGTPGNTYNEVGIGICLVGDFSEEMPSDDQQQALESLVTYLAWKYNIPSHRIITHKDAPGSNTDCPGGELHAHVHSGFQRRVDYYLAQYPRRGSGWMAAR